MDSIILKRSTKSQRKMKLFLLFVAVFGVAAVSGSPVETEVNISTRGLADDWADFVALIPVDESLELLINYLAWDEEVQLVFEFLSSPEFAQLVAEVEQIPEYIAFVNYLEDSGLDAWNAINALHDVLGIERISVPVKKFVQGRLIGARITGGVAGFFEDLLALIPLDECRKLFNEKLETSEEFAHLISVLSSDKARSGIAALKANETYQYIRESLIGFGLDVEAIIDVIKTLIGWN